MAWAVGWDRSWKRDIGYGVPAVCDHPGCGKRIDRGLDYVCGGEVYGGERGCGLFFCEQHLSFWVSTLEDATSPLCSRCAEDEPPFRPTPDLNEWVQHKLSDPSWEQWRQENAGQVVALYGGSGV